MYARVTMTDGNGNTYYALTNPFGYYCFWNVGTGGSYVVSVASKRYSFASQFVTVNDAISGLDFVPR
jgi:hypothetical protein